MTEGFLEFTAVPAEPRAENADIITALLGDYPFSTFEFDGETVKAWAQESEIGPETLNEAAETVAPFCSAPCTSRNVEKENWNEAWEKEFFSPVTVGDRVHIRAPFHPSGPAVEHTITINPRMSFGTGHHATTRLMVQSMLGIEQSFNSVPVLDMGSGTGVLGILAEKLGAASVVAIDNESWAAENAAENAADNGCSHIVSIHGDAAALASYPDESFQVILANIHLNILLADMPAYLRVLRTGGHILFSGFYESDFPMFRANAEKRGLTYVSHLVQDGWCAAVFVK